MSLLPSEQAARMAKTKNAGLIHCYVLLAATAALVLATLYFAVLRGRRPEAAASTNTRLNDFTIRPPKLNLSLAVEVTLRNPNHARFRYGEVVTTVTYHNTTVGHAVAPADSVPARSTATVGAPVQVDADKVILHALYPADVLAGTLPFEATTAVAGRPPCSAPSW
jgi:hypothetical protein